MPEREPTVGLIRFRPRLSEKIWGGRRLETVFGRDPPAGGALPEGRLIGESWEVSGVPGHLTPVAEGPFMGADVYRLAAMNGPRAEEIFGASLVERCREDFPLLVKFLDASDVLSVQVHPGDGYARTHGHRNGKTEAWVVVSAEPGAHVYRGFAPDVGPEDFRAALESGESERVASCLGKIEVSPGDVIDLPAGTVHAIGGGLLLYEVQQSSDATYRVYDWGRLGLDGKPRPLHLEEAWDVMDFAETGAGRLTAELEVADEGARRLVYRDEPPFHLEVASCGAERTLPPRRQGRQDEGRLLGHDRGQRSAEPAPILAPRRPGGECRSRFGSPLDRFEIVSVISGEGDFRGPDGSGARLSPGRTALVPASWDRYDVSADGAVEWVRTWVV